ncbi:hypothetical protein HCR_12520 [Hydrogenimonas cancrithermarum]|uniref:Lipid/polyisoprenoid-binding YceI-like domain-containing protein n=2 Tax=Hydrogenimonas cancrithermarum TaxID=2993563 RepID=A0ABM8FM85_9BACT|nr:hypothetical protein HCR_11350 [Hydrogenimonas cancrithermarum]BDY12940.1 hypothetical protein HCR_12520 [Hydrogenimonas cancrithermarum]
MKYFVMGIVMAVGLFAGECTYSVKDIDVEWKAYKTPLKIGVGGTFDAIKLNAMPDKTEKGLLEGARVVIDTRSVDSKNKGRDAKLVKFFFHIQGVETITAEIKSIEKDVANVEVTMNGITKIVPMKVEFDEDEVQAEGYLDLGDFDMLPSLESINKACYDLHKGKTWQDVKIAFDIKTKRRCQ